MKTRASQMLENIEENILSLFKKLNLPFSRNNAKKLDQSIRNKERFLTAVVRKKGKEFVLKIRLQDDKEVIKDLEREIKLLRFLRKNFSINKIVVPAVVLSGKYRNLQWYLRQYQPGMLAGQTDEDYGLRKEFLKKVSPSELVEVLSSYQSLEIKKIKNLHFYRHGGWWYQQDFNFYRENFLKNFICSVLNNNLLSENEIEEIDKLLSDNKKLLDKEAKYLCHGDLYPNNILITPENKISFLDWGISNFNNHSFDVAFIYLNAWRSEKWKEDFLKYYLIRQKDKEGFKELFRISLISLTIRFSGHCWRHIENKKTPDSKKNKIFLILEMHLKILRTALHNLDSII